jgi:hypothetical protein
METLQMVIGRGDIRDKTAMPTPNRKMTSKNTTMVATTTKDLGKQNAQHTTSMIETSKKPRGLTPLTGKHRIEVEATKTSRRNIDHRDPSAMKPMPTATTKWKITMTRLDRLGMIIMQKAGASIEAASQQNTMTGSGSGSGNGTEIDAKKIESETTEIVIEVTVIETETRIATANVPATTAIARRARTTATIMTTSSTQTRGKNPVTAQDDTRKTIVATQRMVPIMQRRLPTTRTSGCRLIGITRRQRRFLRPPQRELPVTATRRRRKTRIRWSARQGIANECSRSSSGEKKRLIRVVVVVVDRDRDQGQRGGSRISMKMSWREDWWRARGQVRDGDSACIVGLCLLDCLFGFWFRIRY